METSRKAITCLVASVALVCLVSCLPSTKMAGEASTQASAEACGDTIPMHYARNLQLISHDGYLEAVMLNPWDSTRILHRYYLGKADSLPAEAKEATLVATPLRCAAVFNSVHCALLQELGCQEAIGGVCELEYIHLPYVQEGVREGRIADLGNGMQPNIEHIIQLKPDALMPTPFEHSGGYGRIERMGIPIIECADYMESSPLARAEWVRFYGRLFGRAAEADSLFLAVERDYLSLAARAAETDFRPRMICEIPQSGYWFMPAGQSTMGQLYANAGAHYLFDDLKGAGSVSLGIERVLERAVSADVWIIKQNGALKRRQLIADYPALRRIPAHIWCCDLSTSQFYEETPFHPELLLEDLLSVLHPELGIVPRKKYYFEVNE